MMQPAERLNGMGISAIRRIAQGAPEDAISLGLGEPTWDMPEPARRALAAFDGVCSYGPQPGRWGQVMGGVHRGGAAWDRL